MFLGCNDAYHRNHHGTIMGWQWDHQWLPSSTMFDMFFLWKVWGKAMNIPIPSNMYKVPAGSWSFGFVERGKVSCLPILSGKPAPVPTFVSIKLHHQGSNGQASSWAWQMTGGRARHFWRVFPSTAPFCAPFLQHLWMSLECLEASSRLLLKGCSFEA